MMNAISLSKAFQFFNNCSQKNSNKSAKQAINKKKQWGCTQNASEAAETKWKVILTTLYDTEGPGRLDLGLGFKAQVWVGRGGPSYLDWKCPQTCCIYLLITHYI